MIRSIYGLIEYVMSVGQNLTPARQDIISYGFMAVGAILLILAVVGVQNDSASPMLCLISALSLGTWLIAFYISASVVLREE